MSRVLTLADDPVLAALDDLLPGLRALDEAALTQVYDLLAPMLVSLATGLLRDQEQAADVVQDAFVRLVSSMGSLRLPSGRSVRAWLAATVRNRCVDVLRSAHHQRRSDVDPASLDPATQESVEPLRLTDPVLAAAVDALTDDQRTAVLLVHVVGLSGAEAAEAMGCRRTAVYGLVRRGERALRARLVDRDESTRP